VLPDSAPAIAVLASGAGSNFEALVHAATQGSLRARIVVLVSDQAGAGVLDRAVQLGIESAVLPVGRFKTRIEDERPWVDHLRARGVQLIALAGFMRRLHDTMLQAFPDRILNLHPSLLPSFPGLDAIGRAWRHGVQVTGCTVHVVRDEIDGGPIVGQQSVEVRPDDTLVDLERRIHEAEHRLYPHCIDRYLHEPWRLDGRRLIFGRHADHLGSRAASGHA
jgi:phosphoribosylglycinamide formyltransferase-1